MNKYIPSTSKWVRDQVELYEKSNGTEGNTVSHFPVMIVTNLGRKSGAIRKTPLITVKDGHRYVLIASQGGSPKHPNWYYNLRANPTVKIQDGSTIYDMKVTEIIESKERKRLWDIAVKTYSHYQDYQNRTERMIPIFLAVPIK